MTHVLRQAENHHRHATGLVLREMEVRHFQFVVVDLGPFVVVDTRIAHFVVEKLKGLFVPRIKAPTKFPRSSIQRNHIRSGSGGIQSPAYDDGVTLHFGIAPRVFGVEGPHNLQLLYVVAINLLEAGVAGVVGAAAVNTPGSMSGFLFTTTANAKKYQRDDDKQEFLLHGRTES